MNVLKVSLVTLIRRFIYLTLGMIDRALHQKNPIVILCYHSLSSDEWRFSVNYPDFRKQIHYLKSSGYAFISLIDVLNHINGKKTIRRPSVVLTIDDGYKNIFEAKDFFKAQGIKPVLFVLSHRTGADRSELGTTKTLLSAKEMQQLKKEGWTIGSHSATHANLRKVNATQLENEVQGSKESLEKEFSTNVDYFAYPRGRYDTKVINEVSKAGYKLALSMDDGFITQQTNLFRIPRVGVDGTHALEEFKTLYSPSVVRFRKIIKNIPFGAKL